MPKAGLDEAYQHQSTYIYEPLEESSILVRRLTPEFSIEKGVDM
jgi:hypothetical protein